MKRFADLLLKENVQQAQAYLRQNNLPEDDYLFSVIKDRCQGKEGYIGWLTKVAHEDLKPKAHNNGEVIRWVEGILKKISENPNVIELMDKPVVDHDSLEKFEDDYEQSILKYKAKNIYNQFPRAQKDLISINSKDVISLLSKLYDDKNNNAFIRKISSYKTKDELVKGLERFIYGNSNTDFDSILDELDKIGSPILYADENRNIIVTRILTSKQCNVIGSKTSWCIVGSEGTFNGYIHPSIYGKQYAIYLTNLPATNDNRLIGATFNINGFNTAHNVTDGYVSYNKLKDILEKRGFDIDKLKVTKKEIEKDGIDDVMVSVLRKVGFTDDEILKKKKRYKDKDLEEFTKEIIDEYDLLNKIEINGYNIGKLNLTKEDIIKYVDRIVPKSLNIWNLIESYKFNSKDFKDNIDKLILTFDDHSKTVYEKYLSKDKIESVHDLEFGSKWKDYKDPERYSPEKTLFLMDWYGITPDDFSLSELTDVLEDVSTWSIDTTYNKLKDLGYFKDDSVNTVYKFFKNITKGHHTSDEDSLFHGLFKLGYDVSDLVINYYLKKDEDGNYGRAMGVFGGKSEPMDKVFGYSTERRTREKVKEMLKDHPDELEKIIYYDDINEFYKYTLNTAEHTWNRDRDKPSPEKWLEVYGEPNVDLNWAELSGRYKRECLMSYIILMAYNNKVDDLYKLKGINWEAGKSDRGVFGTSLFGYLSELITDIDITNGSATYKLEPKLDQDQRLKLYNWQINFVYPQIEDKDDFEQDLQLVYLIYDRNALNQLIEKIKKYNVVTKTIEIFRPLFDYLLEPRYNKTFFYEQKRFDRILDLKYYLNQILGNYDDFTDKEIEKLEYVLVKNAHYTSDLESFNKSNEIVNEFIDKKRKTPKGTIGTIIGQRKVMAESKVMNFYNFVIEKVQVDFFEKNPDFYLSKNKKDIQTEKERDKEYHKDDEQYNKTLKGVNYKDIKLELNVDRKEYQVVSPEELKDQYTVYIGYDDKIIPYVKHPSEYNYKFILASIMSINKTTMEVDNIEKSMINPMFKEIGDYYALCYMSGYGYSLFLTKDRNDFKEKLTEIRKDEYKKIIYTNFKTKGKELTDYEQIQVNKAKNLLKEISYEDIKFKPSHGGRAYDVILPDGLVLNGFFMKEGVHGSKVYFGHLKNRFHVAAGLREEFKGIGLGYKIYKAFLKHNGYYVSDEQTSTGARKMYYNLLKDDDVLHVIDQYGETKGDSFSKDSQKVLLVWKDHPKIEKLMRIVRKHELRNKRKYKYDKDLLKYIENVKEN